MLSRFLTKLLGSRRDGRSEAERQDDRLEPRLNELRLESLADDRAPSTNPALLVPDTINGQSASLDEQESFDATVTIGNTGTLPNCQDTLAVDVQARALGDALTVVAIASVPFDQTETSALGGRMMGLCTGFELAGTVALDGGTSAPYSFVVTVSLPVLGAMDSTEYVTLQVGGPDEL